MHPGETDIWKKKNSGQTKGTFTANSSDILPGPGLGLHKDCTPGILCPTWTPCRLAAGTQPTQIAKRLSWEEAEHKQEMLDLHTNICPLCKLQSSFMLMGHYLLTVHRFKSKNRRQNKKIKMSDFIFLLYIQLWIPVSLTPLQALSPEVI